jgi:hypothetical protein
VAGNLKKITIFLETKQCLSKGVLAKVFALPQVFFVEKKSLAIS